MSESIKNTAAQGAGCISRRTLMQGVAFAGSLPLLATASNPALAKVSLSSVAYQGSPKDGHDCSNCSLFLPPSSCKSVEGTVAPNGWCKIWVKKAG